MTLSISSRNKQAVSAARRDDIDSSGTAGKIHLFGGVRPASGSAAGTPIATLTLTRPCGTVSDIGLTLTAVGVCQVLSSGVITWARIVDGSGGYVMDGEVKKLGQEDVLTTDFVLDETTVYAGSFIGLISALIAEGG